MEKILGLRQAKHWQRVTKERFDLTLEIVEGSTMSIGGKTRQVALLEDPNGHRYTNEEMQEIYYFMENFKAYREMIIKGLK